MAAGNGLTPNRADVYSVFASVLANQQIWSFKIGHCCAKYSAEVCRLSLDVDIEETPVSPRLASRSSLHEILAVGTESPARC